MKSFLFIATSIFCFVSVVLIIGEELERQAWNAAPSTLPLYDTDEVCVDNNNNNNSDDGIAHVLNCGQCGACSNVQDIRIYHETRSTLTNIMTKCAFSDLLLGGDAYTCLRAESGLTPECSKCWVENYHCNRKNCMATCFKHRKIPFLPSWKAWNSEPLDPCIACDEKFCGPDFVHCAGANRRRTGVISDIERDMEREVCTKVDWDYILGQPKQQQQQAHGDDDDGQAARIDGNGNENSDL